MDKNDMLEKLGELSVSTLSKVQEFLNSAVDFTTEQTPLLINEILTYAAFRHGILIGFGVLVLLLGIYSAVKLQQQCKTSCSHPGWLFGMLVGLGIGGMIVLNHSIRMVKVIIAPRLYLIQYMVDLAKGPSSGCS